MKKILSLLICTMFASSIMVTIASAQGVKWETGTFQDALNKAKNNKKGPNAVFIDCYTSWCGPCKFMTNTIFPTKEAGDYFNKKFVNIKFDMEQGEGLKLAQKYSIKVYPTFLIIGADGKEIGRVMGSDETVEAFIKRVENAVDPANSLDAMLHKFESTHELSDALQYLNKCEDMYIDNRIQDFFAQDLSFIRKYDRYSLRMWHFATKAISFKQPKFLNEVIDNRDILYTYLCKEIVDKSIIAGVTQQINGYLNKRTEVSDELLNKCISALKNICSGTDNAFTLILADVAKAYSQNDADQIKKLLDVRNIVYGNYSLGELSFFQKFFMGFEFISQEDKDKYAEDYKKALIKISGIKVE